MTMKLTLTQQNLLQDNKETADEDANGGVQTINYPECKARLGKEFDEKESINKNSIFPPIFSEKCQKWKINLKAPE